MESGEFSHLDPAQPQATVPVSKDNAGIQIRSSFRLQLHQKLIAGYDTVELFRHQSEVLIFPARSPIDDFQYTVPGSYGKIHVTPVTAEPPGNREILRINLTKIRIPELYPLRSSSQCRTNDGENK